MEIFNLSRGEQLEYQPQEGWNLELTLHESGNINALYRLIRTGAHLESTIPVGPLEVRQGQYSALKVACDLSEACFVINPHDMPGAAWKEHLAYTMPELEFHLQRQGLELPQSAAEMLETMRTARNVLQDNEHQILETQHSLPRMIFQEAGLKDYSSSWTVHEDGVGKCGLIRGFRVRHISYQLEDENVEPLHRALYRLFPNTADYQKLVKDWYRHGEHQEVWTVKDPDKLLELGTGFDHSSIIFSTYYSSYRTIHNFRVSIAKKYPLHQLFDQITKYAQHVARRPDFSDKSAKEAVYQPF